MSPEEDQSCPGARLKMDVMVQVRDSNVLQGYLLYKE